MEELEIGDYINDINSYHLHMFDKHDVTTKKLDVIVEKAGKVDANYAAQIEGYCSLLGEYGKKFETVCAMLALDLIGVKVFRYSDETAEAVASGEKLLKESGTIYESFADMMSPEDAKRYLDFLENGSREGLTGAELAGVEKADALLVSRKVEYEDVWDLRNVGDALESGRETVKIDEFFIDDWTGYPDVPKPDGPFRILEGTEYTDARNLANKTNANIHRNRPDLKGTLTVWKPPIPMTGTEMSAHWKPRREKMSCSPLHTGMTATVTAQRRQV